MDRQTILATLASAILAVSGCAGRQDEATDATPAQGEGVKALQKFVQDALREAPAPAPEYPSIEALLSGVPDDAIPADDADSFAWSKLENLVNRTLPKTLTLELDIEDVTFEAGDRSFKPTLRLGPGQPPDWLLCLSRLGTSCVSIWVDDPDSASDYFHLGKKLPAVGEKRAHDLQGLKGDKTKLALHVLKAKFDPTGKIELTAVSARLLLPEALSQPDREVLPERRFKGRCLSCKHVFLSAERVPQQTELLFPGGEMFLGGQKIVHCPKCRMRGPFEDLGSMPE